MITLHLQLRALVSLSIVVASASVGHSAVRTVALSGQQAPGTPAGALFSNLFTSITTNPLPPTINNSAQTVFAATLAAGGGSVSATNDTGVWGEASGALNLIAREGSSAPGGPAAATYLRAVNPINNHLGHTAFAGRMTGGGVTTANDDGVWSNVGGTLGLIAREGSAAPGTSAGVVFAVPIDPVLSSTGGVAFRSDLTGTGVTDANEAGVWVHRGGSLSKVVRLGEQAPGTPAGITFVELTGSLPLINAANQIAFRGTVTGTGVTTDNDRGIWVERGGVLTLVAREGSQAPGAAAGANFSLLTDPVLNNAGQIAFVSALVGGPGTNNSGVWAESLNTLALVVQRGDPATAAGAGLSFNGFSTPMFNSSGDVGFVATLVGTGVTVNNNTSIWARRDGVFGLVAREGSQPAGAAAGQTFSAFAEHAFNAAGQVAFLGTLTGTGITTANDNGIWVESLGGQLKLVAREGGTLEVSPGVNRTISELFFASAPTTEDGRRTGLNDRGEVAFLAKFTDNSSCIFVSDIGKPTGADFDGDSDADGADFLIWQRGSGATSGASASNGDANGDGAVNADDLAIFGRQFGETPGASASAASVPEPGAALLYSLAAFGFSVLRGHRQRRA